MANGNISGSVNIPTKIISYRGEVTNTSTTIVDNEEKTIAVDVNLDNVQEKLVSGENIKTINSESILGEGNINLDDKYVTLDTNQTITGYKSFDGASFSDAGFTNSITLRNSISGMYTRIKGENNYGITINYEDSFLDMPTKLNLGEDSNYACSKLTICKDHANNLAYIKKTKKESYSDSTPATTTAYLLIPNKGTEQNPETLATIDDCGTKLYKHVITLSKGASWENHEATLIYYSPISETVDSYEKLVNLHLNSSYIDGYTDYEEDSPIYHIQKIPYQFASMNDFVYTQFICFRGDVGGTPLYLRIAWASGQSPSWQSINGCTYQDTVTLI